MWDQHENQMTPSDFPETWYMYIYIGSIGVEILNHNKKMCGWSFMASRGVQDIGDNYVVVTLLFYHTQVSYSRTSIIRPSIIRNLDYLA